MKYQLKTTQGTQELTLGRIIHTGALLVILILSNEASIANCEAKEFDWSDLGVSLANAKATSLGGNASNLRILVSPQRRKSYDFEYTNGSQPSSGSSDPTSGGSYVVASSSPYLGQSVYQLSSGGSAGNHSSHSSAYSALSASLATLKNRLNARGVTLTSTLGGSGDSTSAGNGAYLHQQQQQQQAQQFDPSQQQAQQAQAQAQQQQQQQQQSQPTYLSVSSQQDSVAPSLGAYTVPPSQGNESNKTIVLAIPAKINFLTGGGGSSSSSSKQHSSLQQQQQQQQQQAQHSQLQQAQQLSLLQSSGVLHGQEQGAPTIEQGQQLGVAGEPQEQQHHQYVIVNQQAQGNSDHHSVAASLSPTQTLTSGQTVYSYQPIQHTGGYATIKQYIPATSGPIAAGQPQLQKVYSLVESPAAVPQQQQVVAAVPVQPQQATQYETQLVDQSVLSTSRYTTCLDTCNSSDPRWRKYTVSKYKACCSRSSQFDNSFLVPEQPSVEKVGEQSSRYSEDAYYNYLYRKSQRARRARRHRPSSSRYNRYSSGGGSPASAAGGPEEDSALDSQGQAANSDPQGGRSSSRGAADSYSAKPYYKSLSSARAYALSGAPDGGAQVAADRETARGEERAEPLAKYHERLSKAERSHRRARARDFDAQLDSPPARGGERESNLAPLADTVEDESVYPREPAGARQSSAQPTGSGYGSGEFSVDLQGRGYGSSSSAGLDAARDEDEAAAGRFDEPSELDAGPGKGDDYYSGEVGPSSSGGGSDLPPSSADSGDTETEAATSSSVYNSRYSTGGGVASARRARKPGKARRAKQQKASSSSASSYYKKSRKQPKSKQPLEPLNGTDYESAQPGSSGGGSDSSYYNQQEQTGGSGSGHQQDQESDQASYPQNKESSGYESSEADKEAVLAKYRQSINETAVANLSKTTMHLKEILSILEKKATQQTLASGSGGGSSQKYNESSAASLPVTSTPAPVTTTTTSLYPSLSSLFGANSPYSSSLSSADFLASAADFAPSSLKSPYRFGDPSSPFSSGSLSPSSFSFGGPSSSSASFGSDTFGLPSPPLPPAPYPQYATFAHANKHSMGGVGSSPGLGSSVGGLHVQKKRRPSKSSRYNDLVLQKAAAHGLVSPSSLALHAKNRLLNPTYYSAFQYPYLSYRGVMGQTSGSSITNPYPYKSHAHKNPYSSLLGVGGVGGGSVSSKLAAAAAASTGAGLYSDESRLHGLSSLTDPLANMGSSLRPSAAMRLRNKPFIFQPQVLPIYTRHSILTSPLDVAAAAGAKAAA